MVKLFYRTLAPALSFIFICINPSPSNGQLSFKKEGYPQINVFFVDAHNHQIFPSLNQNSINKSIDFLHNRNYSCVNFPLPVNKSKTNNLPEQLKQEVAQLASAAANANNFQLACKSGSCMFDMAKINVFFSIEYFHGVFNHNINCIKTYKNIGVQYITLINNSHDELFVKNTAKLTPFGEKVIAEMNKQDVKIDIAHLSNEQRLAVIEKSYMPVIISHRNCEAIAKTPGSVSDAVLKAMALKNGHLFLSFSTVGVFKDKNNQNHAPEQWVEHIKHARKIMGIDKIGFGTDMQAMGKYVPHELSQTDTMHKIVQTLLDNGFTKQEIFQLAYKNYYLLF